MNKLAPIVLFVYNRPWHTRKTIEALQKNILALESDLVVFSDGYDNSPKSEEGVLAVREYLRTINGFKSVKIIAREERHGLAGSIIPGVSDIIDQYGRIIVLEDDMVSSQYFLQYMNEALDLYEKEEAVISIHAYIYPIQKTLPETFFLKGADCWGWATWKRGWDLFESDGRKLLKELEDRKLTREFDFSGSYQYTQMLKNQISGKNNSWAIRWYASAFLGNKLTLYPGKSLINNIGLDGSGIHCGDNDNFSRADLIENVRIKLTMVEIKDDQEARQAIANFFIGQNDLWVKGLRYLKIILIYVFKNKK